MTLGLKQVLVRPLALLAQRINVQRLHAGIRTVHQPHADQLRFPAPHDVQDQYQTDITDVHHPKAYGTEGLAVM